MTPHAGELRGFRRVCQLSGDTPSRRSIDAGTLDDSENTVGLRVDWQDFYARFPGGWQHLADRFSAVRTSLR